jgi:hypothetical protein
MVEQESTHFTCFGLHGPHARSVPRISQQSCPARPSKLFSRLLTEPLAWLLNVARGRSLTLCAPGIHVTQSRRVGRVVRRSFVCRPGSN